MIPMHHFLREHSLSGEVTESAPDAGDTNALDGACYRLALTDGPRSFEARLYRPMGAPVPTLEEALAELARRASATLPAAEGAGVSGGPVAGVAPESITAEVQQLRQFLGNDAHTELLFEFGQRPEAEVEQGDAVAEPARPDEMTNQEPEALVEARRMGSLPRGARYLLGIPVLALGAAGVLLARGRRVAAIATAAGGALATVAGAGAATFWRRDRDRQSANSTLTTLSDQNTAIQKGTPP